MEKPPSNIHSLVGDIAKTLKTWNIPKLKPSIIIDDKYLELAKCNPTDKEDSNFRNQIAGNHAAASIEPLSAGVPSPRIVDRPVITFQTPSATSVPNVSSTPALKPSEVQNDLLFEPESLLKLLADDSDVPTNVVENTTPHPNGTDNNLTSTNHQIQNAENPPQPTGKAAPPTMLIIPEYLKVPARIFPLVIGTESYLLPYAEGELKMVVALKVIQAAGEYVVGKVVGCGAHQPNATFPEVVLSKEDEIKLVPARGPENMTIDEQLKFQNLKVG